MTLARPNVSGMSWIETSNNQEDFAMPCNKCRKVASSKLIMATYYRPSDQKYAVACSSTVASLGLVSPGAATDRVTLFFSGKKLTTF